MRFAFAGDRDISVWVLDYLLESGYEPVALCVPAAGRASHAEALIDRCSFLRPERILRGGEFRTAPGVSALAGLGLDLIVGIHFPYLVPPEVLTIPRMGVLNLHPAYLPYNRGWHTPTWAILDRTPIGATLHFMDAGIDTGDIVHQRLLEISPGDTANTLYARLKRLELQVFQEAWPALVDGSFHRTPQVAAGGVAHRRQDLFCEAVQRIDLDAAVPAGDLLRRLRALTTDRVDEAAYYEVGNVRYRVQVTVQEDGPASCAD